jgi:CDP-paratose 2-epimerase
MAQKILITGGAGFVGCNLANHFLNKGYEVTVFDNLSRKGTEKNIEWLKSNHKNKLEFIKNDIRNFDSLVDAVRDKDFIFHTAGQVAVTTSIKNPREDFEINALGTLNVLEAVRKNNSNPFIIFTSTNKVYGNNVNKIPLIKKETRYEFTDSKYKNGIPENFPTDADEHTPYGSSKYAADIYVRDFSTIYGLRTVTFRMSCIYGTRQFGNEDQGWVAYFIISSFFNKPMVIYGDGKQVRDILFIDDLVRVFELACQNVKGTNGNVYNIGGGAKNTISLLELLDLLKNFGLNPKYKFDDWRPADQKVYISDIKKANEFGWIPKITPEIGVKTLLEWVKENKKLF